MTLEPLELLLRAVGGENNTDARQQVALGGGPFAKQSGLYFDLLDAAVHEPSAALFSFRESAGATAAFHVFWRLVPDRIFQPVEPDFRRLAKDVLAACNVVKNDAETQRALALIYKRLRLHYFEGRTATSLDLQRGDHRNLLEQQGVRCNTCGYRFDQTDLDFYFEDDRVLRRPHVPVSPRELVLPGGIVRAPVLDHILPQYIGGDDPGNWQILCGSCNAGKGDVWSLLERVTAPPTRVHHVTGISSRMRYMVIAGRCRSHGRPRSELHIVKHDPKGLVRFSNLRAVERSEL
jgi:hypothetical protein